MLVTHAKWKIKIRRPCSAADDNVPAGCFGESAGRSRQDRVLSSDYDGAVGEALNWT